MHRLGGRIGMVVCVGVAAAGMLAGPAWGSTRGPALSGSAALRAIATQHDPLARPRLGRAWHGYAERYALGRRSLAVVAGKRLAPRVCGFTDVLDLTLFEDRIEARTRAINLSSCIKVVERGVPPLSERSPQESAGMSQARSTPVDPILGDVAENPGGDVADPSDPPFVSEVDPSDAQVETNPPGVDTDGVMQPGVGTGVDSCAPAAGCNGTPEIPTQLTVENGGYSAGYLRTWWEDPVGIDVAVANTHISYTYTPGGCVKRNNPSGYTQLTWYSSSGWELVTDNTKMGRVCGYGYVSTYAYMKNTKFCSAISAGFGKTTKVHFDRNTLRGLADGTLHGISYSVAKGGCVRLLDRHVKLQRTAHDG
jgi:hypothetical protein